MKKSLKSIWLLLLGMGGVGVIGLYVLFDPTPKLSIARQVRVKAEISMLKNDVIDYRNRNGVYPETEQWWQTLGLDSSVRDPWGHKYVYRYPGKRNPAEYDLFSAGPDRLPDTADDDWGH